MSKDDQFNDETRKLIAGATAFLQPENSEFYLREDDNTVESVYYSTKNFLRLRYFFSDKNFDAYIKVDPTLFGPNKFFNRLDFYRLIVLQRFLYTTEWMIIASGPDKGKARYIENVPGENAADYREAVRLLVNFHHELFMKFIYARNLKRANISDDLAGMTKVKNPDSLESVIEERSTFYWKFADFKLSTKDEVLPPGWEKSRL